MHINFDEWSHTRVLFNYLVQRNVTYQTEVPLEAFIWMATRFGFIHILNFRIPLLTWEWKGCKACCQLSGNYFDHSFCSLKWEFFSLPCATVRTRSKDKPPRNISVLTYFLKFDLGLARKFVRKKKCRTDVDGFMITLIMFFQQAVISFCSQDVVVIL